MRKNVRNFIAVLFSVSLSACASLAYKSPESINLSGEWVLDPAVSQTVIFSRHKAKHRAQRGSNGDRDGQGKPKGRRKASSNTDDGGAFQRKSDATVATHMTIEHVSDSMGVLYQSGYYRDIDWGVTEGLRGTVTAGWRDDSLVVKTKGPRRTVTEVYRLVENNTVLIIEFDVDGKTYKRVYRRPPL